MLLGESTLGHVTGIGLAENSVTIARDNLTSLEGSPEVVLDSLITEVITNSSLHLGDPVQDLLVGKTVERTGKSIETSSKRQEGRAESAANQVGGVSTDVSSFVISVNGEVESQQLDEVVVIGKAKLVGKVETVILILLDGSNLSSLKDILVDSGSNGWKLGNQVHGVLESVSPVLGLLHALSVGLRESRLVLKSIDCD